MSISFLEGVTAVTNTVALKTNKSVDSDLTRKQQICLDMYLIGARDLDEIAEKACLSHNGTYAILVLLDQKGLINYKRFLNERRKEIFQVNKDKCMDLINSGVVNISELARTMEESRSPIYRYIDALCVDGLISHRPKGSNKKSIIKYIEVASS